MRMSIFNPCTGTADQIDVPDAASASSIWPFTDDDELMRAREARLAEVRALIESVAEPVAAAARRGVH